jgi:hypothetical protein
VCMCVNACACIKVYAVCLMHVCVCKCLLVSSLCMFMCGWMRVYIYAFMFMCGWMRVYIYAFKHTDRITHRSSMTRITTSFFFGWSSAMGGQYFSQVL